MYLIIGPTCAGKTTAAEFLREVYGAEFIEASDVVATLARSVGIVTSKVQRSARALFAAKGADVVARDIATSISRSSAPAVAVSGLRLFHEIEILRELFADRVTVVYIDAPLAMRFQRALLRKTRRDEVWTADDLDEIDNAPLASGARRVQADDADIVIRNVSSIPEFYSALELVLT